MTDCLPSWGSSLRAVSDLANSFTPLNAEELEQTHVIGLVCKAAGARLGCLLTPAQEARELVADAVWHEGAVVSVAVSCPIEANSKLSQALHTRQTRLIDRSDDGIEIFRQLPDLPKQIDCALAVPVLVQGDVTGLVLLGRSEDQDEFTSSDALFLEALTSVLALGLYNISLRRENVTLSNRLSRVDAQLLQSAKLAATGKLAASIAHEINNPLQSVQSCIYLVADGLIANGPNRQYLDIAREELDRIAKIVQRLADLYRPSEEGQKQTDLNALIENVLALMGKRLQQSNIKVTTALDPDLPPVVIVADQIKQVSFNLILNAVEAMPEGGKLDISSSLGKEPSNTHFEISFTDSGVGIAPESVERIFDPFYTTKAKGTGLGLSISHDIIERHGGSLRVRSQVGSGSTFTVRLPVIRVELE
jgi:signal transduction histidine kinase